MKKIILSSVCGLLALVLVGCSSASEDTAIKNLSNQLDRVTNTVSSISDKQFDSIMPRQIYPINRDFYRQNLTRQDKPQLWQYAQISQNSNSYLTNQVARVQAINNEQSTLKQTLSSQVAMLKTSLKSHVKLSKDQIKALNGVTNNISKYVTSLNNTKTDIANSIKQIKKVSKTSSADQITAHYQNLNNHLDARMCYFQNLLNSISHAERIVLGSCDDCEFTIPEREPHYHYNDFSNNYYNEITPNEQDKKVEEVKDEKKETSNKNIDTYRTTPVKQEETQPVPQQPYYNQAPYYNGYNNGYNNGYIYNRGVNPNRNTDTYTPRAYNIDTYRLNPNMKGINNGYYGGYYNGAYAQTPALPVSASTETPTEKTKPRVIAKQLPVEEELPDLKSDNDSLEQKDKTKIKHYQSSFNINNSLSFDTNKTIEKLIKG